MGPPVDTRFPVQHKVTSSLDDANPGPTVNWKKHLQRESRALVQLEHAVGIRAIFTGVIVCKEMHTSQGQSSPHCSSSGSSSETSSGHPPHSSSASSSSSAHQSPDRPTQPGLDVALPQTLLQALTQVIHGRNYNKLKSDKQGILQVVLTGAQ